MRLDSTITLSLVLGISAIIVPTITSVLNNHHDLKMKKLIIDNDKKEKFNEYKISLIENFLTCFAKLYTDRSDENIQKMQISILKLRPYIDKKYDEEFKKLIDSYSKENWRITNIDEVIRDLKEIINDGF